MGKILFPCQVKKSNQKTSKKSTGGEKDTNTVDESETTDTSYNMVITDAVVAIAGLDTHQYFQLKTIMQKLFLTYVVVLDQIEKNIEKITDPRGEIASGGGGGMSMF